MLSRETLPHRWIKYCLQNKGLIQYVVATRLNGNWDKIQYYQDLTCFKNGRDVATVDVKSHSTLLLLTSRSSATAHSHPRRLRWLFHLCSILSWTSGILIADLLASTPFAKLSCSLSRWEFGTVDRWHPWFSRVYKHSQLTTMNHKWGTCQHTLLCYTDVPFWQEYNWNSNDKHRLWYSVTDQCYDSEAHTQNDIKWGEKKSPTALIYYI